MSGQTEHGPAWVRDVRAIEARGDAARTQAANDRAARIADAVKEYGRGGRDKAAADLDITVAAVDQALARARNLPGVPHAPSVAAVIDALTEHAQRACHAYWSAVHGRAVKQARGEESVFTDSDIAALASADEHACDALVAALQAADGNRQPRQSYENRVDEMLDTVQIRILKGEA